MTLGEIKAMVMFQTNNDADDLGDFMPYLLDYVNEGYDQLLEARDHTHITDQNALKADQDVPDLPLWTHRALADWATWLVYRNGNPQKQNRGYQFRAAFYSVMSQLREMNSTGGRVTRFKNIPE